MTSKAPAVDFDHKFRCKVVDCLKFFRKAKLLHYHMKYFHGIEKSPEPEESPGKRHVQTRGSSAPDKASQESLTRKRVSASSPSKCFHSVLCLFLRGCSGHSVCISDTGSRCWSGPAESQKVVNDTWSSGCTLWSRGPLGGAEIPNSLSYLSLLLSKLPWESHSASEGLCTPSVKWGQSRKGNSFQNQQENLCSEQHGCSHSATPRPRLPACRMKELKSATGPCLGSSPG